MAIEILLGEASGLTRTLTEEAEIVTANLATADNFNLFYERAVHEEALLDTDAARDLADNDTLSMGSLAINTDNSTFKNLNAELVTFLNFLRHTHRVARTHVNHGLLFLCITHFFQ